MASVVQIVHGLCLLLRTLLIIPHIHFTWIEHNRFARFALFVCVCMGENMRMCAMWTVFNFSYMDIFQWHLLNCGSIFSYNIQQPPRTFGQQLYAHIHGQTGTHLLMFTWPTRGTMCMHTRTHTHTRARGRIHAQLHTHNTQQRIRQQQRQQQELYIIQHLARQPLSISFRINRSHVVAKNTRREIKLCEKRSQNASQLLQTR